MQTQAAKNADNLLKYNGTTRNGVAENDTTTPITNWQAALHTAWPGRTGTQTTSESDVTGYARVAIPRSSAGFTVAADGTVTLAATRTFSGLSKSSGSQRLDFFSIGEGASGAGIIEQMGCLVKPGTTANPFTAATSNLITVPAHGAAIGDRVAFFRTGAAVLPTGITEGVTYFIITANFGADSFNVSATSGGSSITISAAGAGTMMVLGGPLIEASSQDVVLQTTTAILVD